MILLMMDIMIFNFRYFVVLYNNKIDFFIYFIKILQTKMEVPLYLILPAHWCKKLSLSQQKKHDQHLQDPLKDLIFDINFQSFENLGVVIQPTSCPAPSGITEEFLTFVEEGESSDGTDSLLIEENDNFPYSPNPPRLGMNKVEDGGMFFQQPYEIDVGEGCSLPQMPSKKGDVDQLPPYQYYGNDFDLENDRQSLFFPYYDSQMGAFRTGPRTFVVENPMMNFVPTHTSFASPSKIVDYLFTDLQIKSLM